MRMTTSTPEGMDELVRGLAGVGPRRVQSETIERRAQWLVVGKRMRLEGREATHARRPGRRRLARDRRSGEVAFGAALPVRLIPVNPEQAAPAKVPLEGIEMVGAVGFEPTTSTV